MISNIKDVTPLLDAKYDDMELNKDIEYRIVLYFTPPGLFFKKLKCYCNCNFNVNSNSQCIMIYGFEKNS